MSQSLSGTSINAILSESRDWRNVENLVPLDFETYWATDYTLSNMSTSEYVRDERFRAHGMAIRLPGENESTWVTHDDLADVLHSIDWRHYGVLCQNTQFDGFILHEHFGIHPVFYADTKSMSRCNFGTEVRHRLNDICARFNLGQKIEHTLDSTKGIRELTPEHEAELAIYSIQDNDLTIQAFNKLIEDEFPLLEMLMIDMSLRMFCDPRLLVNESLAREELEDQRRIKAELIDAIGPVVAPLIPTMFPELVKDLDDGNLQKAITHVLQSGDKLAALLTYYEIEPPTKISPKTGKETWAFAKGDEEVQDLLQDPIAGPVMEARIAVKSTLRESRAARMLAHGVPGPLPICLNHWNAHTGRHGGCDKLNSQNLPSGRDGRVPRLRHAIEAPRGYVIVTVDSRQGEARTSAAIVEQNDVVERFASGGRIYEYMGSMIYGVPEEAVTKIQRFVGKAAVLGCIAEGTPVLCESGWKPIEQVTKHDRVWDGVEWVDHQGLLPKGLKKTLDFCGLKLTPDHQILCGQRWLEAQSVVRETSTRSLALETGKAHLPSWAMSSAHEEESRTLSSNAVVGGPTSTLLTGVVSATSDQRDAISARKKHRTRSNGINTNQPCRINGTEDACLTGLLPQFLVAITRTLKVIATTVREEFTCVMNGAMTALRFSNTLKPSTVGMTQGSTSIASTTLKDMSLATSALYRQCKTHVTGARFTRSKTKISRSSEKLMTYDLAYAGPRNRFTVLSDYGPVIVHNCGFRMGGPKFSASVQLQARGQGIQIEFDVNRGTEVVQTWRKANQKYVEAWDTLDDLIPWMSRCGENDEFTYGPVTFARNKIWLPNDCAIWYQNLRVVQGRYGPQCQVFRKRRWQNLHGGVILENITQAVHRQAVFEQALIIKQHFDVVMMTHDEVSFLAKESEAEAALEFGLECMAMRPTWMPNLPLAGEGGFAHNYSK